MACWINYTFNVIFISSEPGAAPQNVIAVSNTFSSIHVSWDPVPEKQRNGIIIRYEVDVYGYENRYQNVTSTENLTAEIPGLEMFVRYRIYVKAYTRVGPSKNSYPKRLKTLETGTALPDCFLHLF